MKRATALLLAAFQLPGCFLEAYSASHTLGLSDGFTTFETPSFSFTIVNDSQTAYSIRPGGQTGSFDFLPYDVMSKRDSDGQYHLGDITFRARIAGSNSNWSSGDSSQARKKVTALPTSGNTLAAADLSPTLPSNSLLNITRRWVLNDSHLQLLFDVSNAQSRAVEIGALGADLEFNNIFTDRTASDTNNNCSLFDPYIGLDAGYVQVTPLLGTLPPLVVTPVGKSPLEGWRFLPEDTSTDPFYQSQTFEGLYEWQFHTLAYAENEWAAVVPWNNATSAILQPGETRTYGLQFDVAPSIRQIEDTLLSLKRPMAVGIPGYVLPQDQTGKLFLNYASPVRSLSVSPAGALSSKKNGDSLNSSWVGFDITPNTWGRSRLTITYDDGTEQTVHYYVTKAAVQVMDDLGHFLTTDQWFDDPSDPFHRSPSVISYDREVNAVVRNDPRAWIPGLSDEAGAGSWLAASMKQYVQPTVSEAATMETFVNSTLWGSVQNSTGSGIYTVKKSVFFYQPDLVPNYDYPSSIDWTNWWSWNQAASFAIDRAYDYVHVTGAYWAMYRVARNYESIPLAQTWQWFINQAFQTVMRMTDGDVGFVDDGLMDETVFLYLLEDLKREGLTANATAMESRMKARQAVWAGMRFPFASEMAWDSTAQEGVYGWSKYFNDTTTATNTLNSILAYQPTVAHWGYNGNARRYWDNIYGGKLMRIERQIHHYGSGLNALPLMSQFESDPDDFYLLRVAFGGLSGPLTNIDQGGFASASFHSFADTLKWDAYSGDYGPNFVGHALNSGVYLVQHPSFGWQAFGGSVTNSSGTNVQVQVRDSVRRRVFVAPLGRLFTLDAGAFDSFEFNPESKSVTLTILPAPKEIEDAAPASRARVVVKQTTGSGSMQPSTDLQEDAGAWVVPFSSGTASVTFVSA
ncbi:uncharacterized protein FOMMEDRAFT_21464 [Fomitiporia mediterranea MF3/22]|uniref:uncharacterized protein n=1 Tax=Fomitiporia mediterranea (strain MF3/22) TaxID=694068 RepID=UPI000440820D|nr:uncharacterized protein FOMMEDRAFT_21464 [Fomitiporia mediterranea MF3/22]EJD01001.1 hypothetical protein FOMMEDRAFT_21464 [Fomitiporia mediterranea MF3/22]